MRFAMRIQGLKDLPLLRLRGPLADDSTARILHVTLIGLLGWSVLTLAVIIPLVAVAKLIEAILFGFLAISYVAAWAFLNHGALRTASLIYLGSTWIVSTILILWNGGIHSPAVVLYAALPISAAWLLGYGGTIATTLVCVACTLVMVLLEVSGMLPPRYFSNNPWPAWVIVQFGVIVAALPAAAVLRTLNVSLEASRRHVEELRHAEEALRSERDLVRGTMETSPVGIVATDRRGYITFTNASGEAIFGLSKDRAVSRAYNAAEWKITNHRGGPFPDEELPFRRVQSSLKPVQDVDLAIEQPDGQRVLLSVNAVPFFTAAGEFDGMVATFQDVTEQRSVELELAQYRAHLEELVRQRTVELVEARDGALAANQTKSLFLANMSHEMRTPLNSILGFAALMREAVDTPDAQRAQLQIVTRCGEHLLDLINDVLEMAKIESGKLSLDIAPVDLKGLIGHVVDMMRGRANDKGLRLSVDRSSAFPACARADGSKLQQVLINLLGNAVKFTDHGEVTVRLDAEAAGALLLLKLEVGDTGIGIPAAEHARIFKPFVQVGRNATESGTGLGLAIARQYVELMGGTISVESAPGRGSRFRVAVPVERLEATEPAAEMTPVPESGADASATVLTPEALESLPEELRAALAEAVVHTDIARVRGVIRRISDRDGALGATLAGYAGRFAFTPILQAVRACNNRPIGEAT